jgi:hypothetical protein
MAVTQKVSVSIERGQLRWAKSLSKRAGVSVSSVLSEALRFYREEKARELAARQLLAKFAPEDRASPDEAKALLAKWRG